MSAELESAALVCVILLDYSFEEPSLPLFWTAARSHIFDTTKEELSLQYLI